jgi:hypothetical protein
VARGPRAGAAARRAPRIAARTLEGPPASAREARARQTSKATPWKAGDHNGRARLQVLDRLARLDK